MQSLNITLDKAKTWKYIHLSIVHERYVIKYHSPKLNVKQATHATAGENLTGQKKSPTIAIAREPQDRAKIRKAYWCCHQLSTTDFISKVKISLLYCLTHWLPVYNIAPINLSRYTWTNIKPWLVQLAGRDLFTCSGERENIFGTSSSLISNVFWIRCTTMLRLASLQTNRKQCIETKNF